MIRGGAVGEQSPSAAAAAPAPFDLDKDDTGFEATERLQTQFAPEEFAAPEDRAELMRVTEGISPEQTAVALDHLLEGLAGTGEVDAEEIARATGMAPEKALEMVAKLLDVHSRMITTNVFNGDAELHREFVQWALKNDRAAYVKATEAVARTQSSKPMAALVQRRIAALKATQAPAREAAKGKAPGNREMDPGERAALLRIEAARIESEERRRLQDLIDRSWMDE